MIESILHVDRVQKADGAPVDLTGQSGAKAYFSYNGASSAPLASFNLSSVTDHATGNYGMNLISAMIDKWPVVSGCTVENGTQYRATNSVGGHTASQQRILTRSPSQTSTDYEYLGVTIHGDLA